MRAIYIFIAVSILAAVSDATNVTSRAVQKWTNGTEALVYEGKVMALEATPAHRWIVRMSVDSILQGHYSGTNFSFTVHSPSKSGLTTGATYRVKADITDFGYTIDEHQWSK